VQHHTNDGFLGQTSLMSLVTTLRHGGAITGH